MEAELFLAEGQTDGRTERHDEAFCNYANAPKTGCVKNMVWYLYSINSSSDKL